MNNNLPKSSQAFLTILADYVNRRSGTYHVDDDVLLLARTHQLEAMMYSCTHAPQLQQKQMAQLYYYQNRKVLLHKIDAAFCDIPYIIVKGTTVSDYYPMPFHRSMGDTDIIIHSQDRNAVDKALISLGFSRGYNYWYSGMEVEVHNQLIYEGDEESKEVKNFMNNFWSYVKDGQLDWSFHFLFLLVHLKRHMIHSGCGVRQFLDIAILIRYNEQLNWSWITEKAKMLGLFPFLESCLFLCKMWFDISLPMEVPSMSEDVYRYMTEMILKNGIFGNQNKETKKLNRSVRDESATSLRQKLIAMLGHYFPSYETMKGITYYSFIEGKVFLLPVAWCYRAIRGVTMRKRILYPQNVCVDKDKLEFHKQVLMEIGVNYMS